MDREDFCKTSEFDLNSNGIQMLCFKKKTEMKKETKQTKIEKGSWEPFQPRPGRGPRPRNPSPNRYLFPFFSLSVARAPPIDTTPSSPK
jgi:hypothetical protein